MKNSDREIANAIMGKFIEDTGIRVFYSLYQYAPLGCRVHWKNIWGQTFQGIIKEWDSNVAVITVEGGREMAVEC